MPRFINVELESDSDSDSDLGPHLEAKPEYNTVH